MSSNHKIELSEITDNKWVCCFFTIGIISSFVEQMEFAVIFLSLLMMVYYDLITFQDSGTPWTGKLTAVYMSALEVWFLLLGGTGGMILAYTMPYFAIAARKKGLADHFPVVLAVYASLTALNIFMDIESHWSAFYILIQVPFFLFGLLFLTRLMGMRAGCLSMIFLLYLLRLVNHYYRMYRFSFFGIMDIFCIPTFLEVAGDYTYKITTGVVIVTAVILVLMVPFAVCRNVKYTYSWKLALLYLFLSCAGFMGIGVRAYYVWNQPKGRSLACMDALALSVVDEVIYLTKPVDEEGAKKRVNDFPADAAVELKPNIISVMSESYADVAGICGLEVKKNPVERLRSYKDGGVRQGSVHVNTVGGGTSVSEWEYLSGLNRQGYSIYRVPFFLDCKKNYTFSASGLYDDYKKVYMHPYYAVGWGRSKVYQAFEYDEAIFLPDMEISEEDKLRRLVKDEKHFEMIRDKIGETADPLFCMSVTIQNHGGFLYEDVEGEEYLLGEILGTEDLSEEVKAEKKRAIENYLRLTDRTTTDVLDFVQYLKEHPEEPTLFIYWGDHYPSGISTPESGISYETPYFVYSNFCDLGEMPDYMDMSLLYPYAKRAAGLPLSSWEKYLLSLDGATADRDMIMTRIRNGEWAK